MLADAAELAAEELAHVPLKGEAAALQPPDTDLGP